MSEYTAPERLNLLDFLSRISGNNQLVIPAYQRNYVWNKNQAKALLNDYEKCLSGEYKKHFIGIMMYLSVEAKVNFYERHIVDGQQRMVTVFLMLQVLKEIACESGVTDKAEQINEMYLTNKWAEGDLKFKLKPLVSDDNVYKKIITNDTSSISQKEQKSRVYANYLLIKDKMIKMYGKYDLDAMISGLNKLYMVVIPLSTDDNAQKIFETINSAGEDLSNTDLIRNYVLMNIESTKQDDLYMHKWRPIEELFEDGSKIESFFRVFLANKTKELPNMEAIYNAFQKWHAEDKRPIEEVLTEIYKYGNYYCNLFFPNKTISSELPQDVKKSLREFQKNTVEPVAPFLMEVYMLYDTMLPNGQRKISSEDFRKIIELFETYNMRRNLCNLRSGVLTRIIPIILRTVMEKCSGDYSRIYDETVKALVDDNRDKASFMPDDAYMKANLLNINAYGLKKYVKTAFEKIENDNNSVKIEALNNLSIEHLMPQTPTQEWINELKINIEDYESQLHRLGNLTLASTSDNSKMSNHPYDYKKEVLKNTGHLKMNMELLEKESWTVEDIENRTKELINQICKVYPYVSNNNAKQESYNIFYKGHGSNITAVIYDNQTVEVFADSYFDPVSKIDNKLQTLIDEDVIVSEAQGYRFVAQYIFESIKTASDYLIGEYDNPWEEWIDSKGESTSLNLRAKIQNIRQNEIES